MARGGSLLCSDELLGGPAASDGKEGAEMV